MVDGLSYCMGNILFFILILVSAAGAQPAVAQPVAIHGRLKVEGSQLLDEHGRTVDWLHRDWNCSVVRAAMGVESRS